ncbi:sigma-70 family RNA polymerase sigma factor [Actinomadura spongiicola]|uniref:Sigma-70 family RNA polymerase sigma factor n=1 Tax=Actinomadura spongiicola TaxID=2303421 RepID=A0A372GP91_9ACTN|nr:sigma-70 family RNA polymerase sigma factor [Actinomadura spongiicola]
MNIEIISSVVEADAHYDDVLAYAARRVDHETARDVAAETFLVAWRRRKDIPADRPFPWLLHVARNVLANEARGRRWRGRLWGRLRDDRDHQRPVDDIATGLAEGGRIHAALRRLPERDREALRLVGWECLNTQTGDLAHRRVAPVGLRVPRGAATRPGCSPGLGAQERGNSRLHRRTAQRQRVRPPRQPGGTPGTGRLPPRRGLAEAGDHVRPRLLHLPRRTDRRRQGPLRRRLDDQKGTVENIV